MNFPNFILKFCLILMIFPVTLVCCYFGYLDKNYQIVIFGFALLFFAAFGNYIIYTKGSNSGKGQ